MRLLRVMASSGPRQPLLPDFAMGPPEQGPCNYWIVSQGVWRSTTLEDKCRG